MPVIFRDRKGGGLRVTSSSSSDIGGGRRRHPEPLLAQGGGDAGLIGFLRCSNGLDSSSGSHANLTGAPLVMSLHVFPVTHIAANTVLSVG